MKNYIVYIYRVGFFDSPFLSHSRDALHHLRENGAQQVRIYTPTGSLVSAANDWSDAPACIVYAAQPNERERAEIVSDYAKLKKSREGVSY